MRCALVLLAGCSQIFGLNEPTRSRMDDAAIELDGQAMDAAPDGADAMGAGAWGTPMLAFPSTSTDDDPTLTADLLEMYFDRGGDIWMTTRQSIADAWATPTKNEELSSPDTETTPEVHGNGLYIAVSTNRPSSQNQDVWYSLRNARTDPWPAPELLPIVNSAGGDVTGNITADTFTYVLSSNRTGGTGDYDLYIATRANAGAVFSVPAEITELSTAAPEYSPFIMPDGMELYFDRNGDIYHSVRDSLGWGPALPVTELNTGAAESDVWVSPDGRTIYFSRGGRIYYATR